MRDFNISKSLELRRLASIPVEKLTSFGIDVINRINFLVPKRLLVDYIRFDPIYSIGIHIIAIFHGYNNTVNIIAGLNKKSREFIVQIPNSIPRRTYLYNIVNKCLGPCQYRTTFDNILDDLRNLFVNRLL